MRGIAFVVCGLGLLVQVAACGRITRQVRLVADPPAAVGERWQEPSDIQQRDVFHGPGGPILRPRGTAFTFVARDTGGWSPGFDVRAADGTDWSVKLGPEAQSEVVSSRILWAIGFHQAGRFRPSLADQKVIADWSWYENPFVGSRAFGGLIVANLMLNSGDWKTSNNKIYQLSQPVNGVSRWFVVRDLGASLGRTTYPHILKWIRLRGFGQGTRNDLPGFEAQGFINRIDAESVDFSYRGIYRDVVDTVTPADVRWACGLLARLTDDQWRDAFRAGGYTPEQTARYVTKIKSKIAQGLDLTAG
jgi:hypothetical protein